MAVSILENAEISSSSLLVICEEEVLEGEVRVREPIRRKRSIVLDFEVSKDWLDELQKRK